MSLIVRPLAVALAAFAFIYATLFATSYQESPAATSSLPAAPATVQVDGDDIQNVASAGDCAEAAAILVPAFRARGVLAKEAQVTSALSTIYSWWPGTECGNWLAKHVVVPTICSLSSKPAWVPGRGTARWIVWFVSLGESTQCVN